MKAVVRGKFIVFNTIKKERSKINHFSFHLRILEEERKLNLSKRKEIITIRAEIN